MMNDKILIAKLRMIEAGVVPAFTGNDLVNMLKSLPRSEQKRAKRKFRKQWRKIMKNEPHTTATIVAVNLPHKQDECQCGLGSDRL